MKVAFVVTEFPSLSVTFIIDQIAALIERGYSVDIYAARRGNMEKVHCAVTRYELLDRTTFAPSLPRNPIVRVLKATRYLVAHPLTYPAGRLRVLNVFGHGREALTCTRLYKVMSFLPQRSYDIIHCHFAVSALRVLPALNAGILRGRLMTTLHGFDVSSYPRTHGPDVYRELFDRCPLFTANSGFTIRCAAELGCPVGRIVKLPVGVDLRRFPFRERKLEPDGEIRIFTVARLVEEKGIEYGIRAVAKVLPTHPNVRYVIAGDGPLMGELRNLANELGVQDRVDFLGGQVQEQIRRLYAHSHLFIFPGVVGRNGAQEAQGLVLLEAQASGLPVLATRVGGVPESMLEGESGFLVPPRDVDALAVRLSELIENPNLWPQMGTKGRRFVEDHFDFERIQDSLEALYRRLVGGGRDVAGNTS